MKSWKEDLRKLQVNKKLWEEVQSIRKSKKQGSVTKRGKNYMKSRWREYSGYFMNFRENEGGEKSLLGRGGVIEYFKREKEVMVKWIMKFIH